MLCWVVLSYSLIIKLCSSLLLENYCEEHPASIQCRALGAGKRDFIREACRSYGKDCERGDFIHRYDAACHLESQEKFGYRQGLSLKHDKHLRCMPDVSTPTNIFQTRVTGLSSGRMKCVPTVYNTIMQCGEQGTRCVCKAGGSLFFGDANRNLHNKCRCQWFGDFCKVPGICSKNSLYCLVDDSLLRCRYGSINQCLGNPNLCVDKNSYCVELEDRGLRWTQGKEVEGEGFACINKALFKGVKELAPYCDFNNTDIPVSGSSAKRPKKGIDTCCYQYLVCVKRGDKVGGYLFKMRPCYCRELFKKCLIEEKGDRKFRPFANALIEIVDSIKECTMTDGKCNPLQPQTCQKGDLIDPSLAHCKVNCKTGPLLPIQFRSCRIRKCKPMNDMDGKRVIDITYHKESSRCDAVPNLLISCGLHHTRCVCDGEPTIMSFTDRCRCQYWPP